MSGQLDSDGLASLNIRCPFPMIRTARLGSFRHAQSNDVIISRATGGSTFFASSDSSGPHMSIHNLLDSSATASACSRRLDGDISKSAIRVASLFAEDP